MSSLFRGKKSERKCKPNQREVEPCSIRIRVPIPKFDANKRGKNYKWESSRRKTDRRRSLRACKRSLSKLSDRKRKNLKLPWNSARLVVKWYHPTKRKRDPWNIVGCLKGTLDGIVDAGIIKDDDKVPPPEIELLTDSKDPRVEIEIFYKG